MTTAGDSPEVARGKAVYRTIPDAVFRQAVDGTGGTIDLTAVTATEGGTGAAESLIGKWVFLEAKGADVTIIRKASAPGTAGRGFTLKDGQREEFYVAPDETQNKLGWKASAAGNLDIEWDSKL